SCTRTRPPERSRPAAELESAPRRLSVCDCSSESPVPGCEMATDLPKQYDPQEAQRRWLPFWEEQGYFHSRPEPGRQPYTIVIPPANVSGALHMGHALNNALQDVLIRWRRAQGFNAEWMPGTDHAGIATQAVVLRRIKDEEGKTAREIGREEFLKRTWQW